MIKNKIVVFEDGYAKIFTNPPKKDIDTLRSKGFTILENPNIEAVRKVAPEFWKLNGSKLVPMNPSEKEERRKDQDQDTISNSILIKVEADKSEAEQIIKEIPVEIEKIKEVTVEIERLVEKQILKVPYWLWIALGISLMLNVVLILK